MGNTLPLEVDDGANDKPCLAKLRGPLPSYPMPTIRISEISRECSWKTMEAAMTDDQARRFAEWQDGLTLDILEQSIPAIADDLADWCCRNHRPALDPASFPETLRAALLRRICAWCGERIRAGQGFDTRARDLKACGPICCDRINEPHGV